MLSIQDQNVLSDIKSVLLFFLLCSIIAGAERSLNYKQREIVTVSRMEERLPTSSATFGHPF